jgi:hypothetical protein
MTTQSTPGTTQSPKERLQPVRESERTGQDGTLPAGKAGKRVREVPEPPPPAGYNPYFDLPPA